MSMVADNYYKLKIVLSLKYPQKSVMGMAGTSSPKSLSSLNMFVNKTPILVLRTAYQLYRETSSILLQCQGGLGKVLAYTTVDSQPLIPAVLVLLKPNVYYSCVLSFIPSKVWSCYSAFYLPSFAGWLLFLLSLFLILDITYCCVLVHYDLILLLRISSKIMRNNCSFFLQLT